MGAVIDGVALAVRRRGKLLPKGVRTFLLRHLYMDRARAEWWISQDPYVNDEPYSSYDPVYPYRLGILQEPWHRHWPYVAACRELRVAYELVDISGPDWIDRIEKSNCDAFLVWPPAQLSIWKEMYDERLRIVAHDLGRIIYPQYHELWLYESKRRMHYWLRANSIPHVHTRVYYSLNDALAFAGDCVLPVVVKTNMGAASAGVKIFRHRSDVRRHVRRAFKKGIIHNDGDARDGDWGNVVFQEFLPGIREWRIVRVGQSYFGYEKLRKDEFHSGSLLRQYGKPPDGVLAFAKRVTDAGKFTVMDVDLFETIDGRYLVNELQTVWGMSRPEMCVVDGKPGRMLCDSGASTWRFESGEFCRNRLCNLRILHLLESIGSTTISHRDVSDIG